MRAYLTAHAGKQHEKHFGWKTFRVLTVTTDHHRMQSMMEALRRLRIPHSPGAPLFFFTTRDELRASDPLAHDWRDGNGRAVRTLGADIADWRCDRSCQSRRHPRCYPLRALSSQNTRLISWLRAWLMNFIEGIAMDAVCPR